MAGTPVVASEQVQNIFYALTGASEHKAGWLFGFWPEHQSAPTILSSQLCNSYAATADRSASGSNKSISYSVPDLEREEAAVEQRTPGGVAVVGFWFSYSSSEGKKGIPVADEVLGELSTLYSNAHAVGSRRALEGLMTRPDQRQFAVLAVPIGFDGSEATGAVQEPCLALCGAQEGQAGAISFSPAKELATEFLKDRTQVVVSPVEVDLSGYGDSPTVAAQNAAAAIVSQLRHSRFLTVDASGQPLRMMSLTTVDATKLVQDLVVAAPRSETAPSSATSANSSPAAKSKPASKKSNKKGKGGKKKKGGGGGSSQKLLMEQMAALSAADSAVAVIDTPAVADSSSPTPVELQLRISTARPTKVDGSVSLAPLAENSFFSCSALIQCTWYCRNDMTLKACLAMGEEVFASAVMAAAGQAAPNTSPTSLFFQPSKYCHAVCHTYALSASEPNEDYLITERSRLHKTFMLPENAPMFRTCNSKAILPRLTPSAHSSGRLQNVHEGLPSLLPSGTQHLVDGTYDYYHYLQDRIDDNGWGCAYRSMQTICSWIQQQGYSAKAVPTHKEIQQALVAMNDKPKSFVGSSQWIGAFEISLCLDHFYGISCKILNCSSGADIKDHARTLAAHFDNHGSPVMIGGGVLAYTLLGVDWDEKTGDVRFLILDPHYIGSENLDTIQQAGWCNWKEGSLFRADAFYNLCMPQRPKCI